jgi:hypothetical protein
MAQKTITQIPISEQVKTELERRKNLLSNRKGRKVSYDYVLRDMMGWN